MSGCSVSRSPSTTEGTSRRRVALAPSGGDLTSIDTPSLVLDLDRFERNSRRILDYVTASGVAWRPHSKAHKSSTLARLQCAMGAVGVTCAKVSEAEVMVNGGVPSILIANELAALSKLDRVARLQERAEVIICADAPIHVELAAAAAVAAGVEIPMLVEVDIGMARAGAAPGGKARDLARLIDRTPSVRFVGVMSYEGQVLTLWPPETKEAAAREAIGKLLDTVRLIERDGLAVGIVSCGGSGSFVASAAIRGVTEIQAGGACYGSLLRRRVPSRRTRLRVCTECRDHGDEPAYAKSRSYRRGVQGIVDARRRTAARRRSSGSYRAISRCRAWRSRRRARSRGLGDRRPYLADSGLQRHHDISTRRVCGNSREPGRVSDPARGTRLSRVASGARRCLSVEGRSCTVRG